MYFDLKAFLRYNFRAYFKTRGEQYRLTPKRFLILTVWLILYIPAQFINRLCFVLDDLLFPQYRRQEVRTPIFIVGNPRSGTTFLHRLMYKDAQSFTAFTVWELVLAPSIVQRKIIWAFVKMGKLIGVSFRRVASSINRQLEHRSRNSAHKIKINDAEEDEHILIHIWSTESLWPLYPFRDEMLPYFFFDRDIPKPKQQKIMRFYKSMLQRHLYAHGGNKILLSKNPSFTAKLAALLETFPDAHFINIVRTPLEVMPSMLDYMSSGWKIFCDPLEPYPYKEEFFKVMNFYYLYPFRFFQNKDNLCKTVKYEYLVKHPDEIVEELYTWLELDYSENFREIVASETQAAHQYRSQHQYSIEKMGLSEERIAREFKAVFNVYAFNNLDVDLRENVMFWKINEWPKAQKARRMKRRHDRKVRKLAREFSRRTLLSYIRLRHKRSATS